MSLQACLCWFGVEFGEMHIITKQGCFIFNANSFCEGTGQIWREVKGDTGDIEYLILKVSLDKGLGGLFLVCLVKRDFLCLPHPAQDRNYSF